LETIIEAIQAIQAILAPAVMITGVALLLLTFNARHSSLVNRIRLLDDEERKLLRRRPKLDKIETLRLKSIKTQLDLLLSRLLYVRNGMICLLLAATFFVLTSFSIGLAYFSASTGLTQTMINFTFIPGMLLVLIGVLFLAIEVYISYRVIEIEVMKTNSVASIEASETSDWECCRLPLGLWDAGIAGLARFSGKRVRVSRRR